MIPLHPNHIAAKCRVVLKVFMNHALFSSVLNSPHFTCILSAISKVTGPNKPDGIRGVSLVSLRMFVFVCRFSGGSASSPMMRLGQKLTTSTYRFATISGNASVGKANSYQYRQ